MTAQHPTADLDLLRRAIAVAEDAKDAGRHPFGALVADGTGQVVSSAGNNAMPPEGDPTQHAGLRALAEAASQPCREVISRGQRHIDVVGPLLEEGAAAPHIGFWN